MLKWSYLIHSYKHFLLWLTNVLDVYVRLNGTEIKNNDPTINTNTNTNKLLSADLLLTTNYLKYIKLYQHLSKRNVQQII